MAGAALGNGPGGCGRFTAKPRKSLPVRSRAPFAQGYVYQRRSARTQGALGGDEEAL